MHTLDIMLPFWGEPSYLFETVEAVRNQSVGGWKLTVVDDCYPDPQVGEYFSHLEDERVTYIRNENNLGITQNYEHCVELASAELIMLLGCDDVPERDFVERILKLHSEFPSASIIQPGVRIIDESSSAVTPVVDRVKSLLRPDAQRPRLLSGEDLAVSLLRADWLYWPSLVFKREVFETTQFRPGFPIIQDLALVMDVIVAVGSLLFDPYVCFAYRRHAESASSTALFDGRRFQGERDYFAIAEKLVLKNGWRRAARAARIHSTSRAHALTLLPQALKQKDNAAVSQLLKHVIS